MSRFALKLSAWLIASLATVEASESIDSFLADHCFECHDDLTQKAGLRLDLLSTVDVTEESADTWALVLRRLEADEMPHRKRSVLRMTSSRKSWNSRNMAWPRRLKSAVAREARSRGG